LAQIFSLIIDLQSMRFSARSIAEPKTRCKNPSVVTPVPGCSDWIEETCPQTLLRNSFDMGSKRPHVPLPARSRFDCGIAARVGCVQWIFRPLH